MTDLPVEGGNAHRHYGTDGYYITERAFKFIDVVLGNASISKHGLMAKLSNNADEYYNGVGTWIGINVDILVVKTDTFNLLPTQHTVICDKGTSMSVNLYPAIGSKRRHTIKSVGVGVVTVDGDSSETIDGVTTKTLNQWEYIEIVDYETGKWAIV
jgi:hypothetical protein